MTSKTNEAAAGTAADKAADASPQTSESKEAHEFQAEVARLLHLMVHSVYSNKDIFLRELISNAADACERLRQRALTEPELISGDETFRIRLETDKNARTLSVADNGTGMSREELIDNLGTIARSGTRAFLEGLGEAKDGQSLIGQFGVGFYSAFMVAGEVDVVSRAAGSNEAWTWRSDGQGSFTVERADLESAPARGTRVVLHLSDESVDYAQASTIERIVREYSAHVPVPIVLASETEREENEPDGEEKADKDTAAKIEEREIADGSALWTRSRSEITEEEYKEFYGHVSRQFDEPALTLHYRAEGRHEYSVLLFVPSMTPFDLFDPDRKGRVKLYVRRVFIADDVDLLPAYLRFTRGVIDSQDLPLNLSREMLQSNPVLDAIRKGVTNRVLSELQKLADNDAEKYTQIWETFGPVIKEGLYEDFERRDKLLALTRFKTTKSGDGWRTLAEYVADLKENQTQIFYAIGDNADAVKASPQLEGYRARDVEVLLLSDPVDAFWVQIALGFDGKPFRSVTQGAADLDAITLPDDEKQKEDEAGKGATADVATLVTYVKETLGDAVTDVRISSRLAESPVCLVAPEHGPDRQFEKLMSRRDGAPGGAGSKPVLEINPRHALVKSLASHLGDDAAKDFTKDAAWLLYDQARILDGEHPNDPAAFAGRLARVMKKGLG
ncbi:molecular chaperone HtpG [Breoghania corrubedonensis]|uniref:Chaperone protein HtpG n=1 Tax=Breoghania corrubedonensis TaxID=665038 RepID=A0A2T5V5R0_9HYPH|nr:molecular chaperone HtpG [Breoghania corrubedonensis]PTW59081.1 molecular chaperone HtpG [Breoghania corrubedonensis]